MITHTILEITLAHENGPVDIAIVLSQNSGDPANITFRATHPDDAGTTTHEQSFEIANDLPADLDAREDALILSLSAPETFDGGVFGIGPGLLSVPREVRIELRPDTGPESFGLETPHLAIFVCHDVEAGRDEEIDLAGGGKLNTNVTAKADVCLGFAAIFPPTSDPGEVLGAENYALRIDASSLGLTTGWVPLPSIDLPGLPTLPDIDIELPELTVAPLLRWFVDLIPDFDFVLPKFNWDIRFPALPALPLGLSVDDAWIEVSLNGDETRVQACVEGLRLTWVKDGTNPGPEDPSFHWDNFRLCLSFEDGDYKLSARLYQAQFPTADDQAESWGFALPFRLLGVEAACWYFHVGLHLDEERLCFEALLEVGGLKVTSRLASGKDDGEFYNTDLRILLRDLTVVSNPVSGDIPLFFNIKAGDRPAIFNRYSNTAIRAYSFAEDLLADPGDTPARKRFEFLDGAFREGERLFVAWEQEDGALMEFVARKLLGRRPPPASGDDADRTRAALEIAWFPGEGDDDDLQIRFDWADVADLTALDNSTDSAAEETSGDSPDPEVLPADAAVACFSPADLKSGILLPDTEGNFQDLGAITTGEDALALELPGVRLSLARPSYQTLLYGRDTEGRDSLSYLLQWQGDDRPVAVDNEALASMRLGFTTRDGEGTRHVQSGSETGSATPADLFELHLGMIPQADAPEVLQVAGWTEGRGPDFFQVYDRDALRLPRIIPARPALTEGDPGCPTPSPPALKAVQLSQAAFTGISLKSGDMQPWRLALRSSLTDYLLNMFGGNDGRRIKVSVTEICPAEDGRSLIIRASVTITLSSDPKSPEIAGTMGFRLDLRNLALTVEDGAELSLNQPIADVPPSWVSALAPTGGAGSYKYTKPLDILGLELVAMAKPDLVVKEKDSSGTDIQTLPLLTATFDNGSFALLVDERVDLMLHFDGLGEDGLTFLVEEFFFGPGGIDLKAGFLPTVLKLPGLRKPFSLENASLVVRDDRIERVEISGKGVLPELLNEAPVEISAALDVDSLTGRLVLDTFACELGDKDAPIFSTGTQCEFTLSKLSIGYDDKNGTAPKAWHFLISGYMQFLPEGLDFAGELLEDFSSIRMEFSDAPLSDEFFEHVELIATLTEPKRFKVFALFDMEVRGIGFHPSFEPFGNRPAIIIAGQCEFADLGDVLSVEVDFHRLYLGAPKRGEILPQVHFKGLRVEIASSGFKIAGRVEVPDNGLVKGFKGEGTLLIPGMPEISAAFGFVKLRASEEDSFKRGWFIAVELARISFQIGPLPLYLRQIGLGFGYRYTSVIIKKFESEDELGPLIKGMQAEIDKHQALARIDTWAEDPERDRTGERARWSIGLEAVFSMASANKGPFTYDKEGEQKFKTVVAQMLIFIRSDFTFLAAAKVWLPVSTDDFFENVENMRTRPLATGFMIYSAPKSRLLIHAAKGQNPYLGPKDKPVPESVKKILDNSHFEATLLSEPGLLHAELGWPDRLFFRFDIGLLTLECRGGVLFRAEKDMLVQGIYYSARGEVKLDGDVSLGIVGVGITAHISVSLAMRLMIGISLSKPAQSSIYAAVGIDVSVKFEVRAWLRIKLSFCTITLRLRFGFEIQIIVALELGWAGELDLGFRARATVIVGAFGRQLKVKVNVGIREGGVRRAYAKLAPYMRSYIDPGEIPPIPGITSERAINPLDGLARARAADLVELHEMLELRTARRQAAYPGLSTLESDPDFVAEDEASEAVATTGRSRTGDETFSLALMQGNTDEAEHQKLWFGWIIPTPGSPRLYPVPVNGSEQRLATLRVPHRDGVRVFQPRVVSSIQGNRLEWSLANKIDTVHGTQDEAILNVFSKTAANLSAEAGGSETLSLAQFLAGCYVPEKKSDFGTNENPFPANWPEAGAFKLSNVEDDQTEVLKDDRPLSGAQSGPRQALDPDNAFDSALIQMRTPDAVELAGGDAFSPDVGLSGPELEELLRFQLEDQAEGNFSFLMRGFLDDLKSIARDVALDGNNPAPWLIPDMGRPMITDLGLFVCVVAQDCPDWLCAYDDRASAIVWENVHATHGAATVFDSAVRPVVDFSESDFAQNPPQFRDLVYNLDDETLNVGWDLTWGQLGVPKGPRTYDPEDFLEKYEVVVTQANRSESLGTFDVGPGDGFVELNGERGLTPTRLKLRYQFNKPVAELGIGGDAAARSRLARIAVRITPVALDGTRGTPMEVDVEYRPSARPLPPDDAAIELRRSDDGMLEGTLGWRELAPPNAPDVTNTLRWDLVLRPLPALPLGAWPAEASATEDSGLMGGDALAPRDGDLVVVLSVRPAEGDVEMPFGGDPTGDAADRDPALARYRVMLDGTPPENMRVFDHQGQEIAEDAPRFGIAKGFFERTPSVDEQGRAWQVFLRASGQSLPAPGERLPQDSVSGLVRLRMALRGPRDPETDLTALRPIDHLEWTIPLAEMAVSDFPHQVPSTELWSSPGPIHRAAFVPVLNPANSPDLPKVNFQRGSDDARGVRISWNAARTGDRLPAIAAWNLYESRADDLVNFDRVPARQGEFSPIWSLVRTILPAEPALAQRAVTSFVQPEVWEVTPPWRARVEDWRAGAKTTSNVDPAGWSWNESVLVWPDRLIKLTETLEAASEEADNSFAFTDMYFSKDETDPAARTRALAARLDVGRFLATPGVHPWLGLVLGTLALRGAPPTLGGVEVAALFEVEVSPGKPVPPPEGPEPDPLGWMQTDVAEADPLGWGALSHLGLAATIALRDPVSRLYLGQQDVRKHLTGAIKDVSKLLGAFDEALPDLLDHLAFDLPLQTHRALRTDAATVTLGDDSSLSMVQIALRPIPRRRAAWTFVEETYQPGGNGPGAVLYAVVTFEGLTESDLAKSISFDQDVAAIHPDREMARASIDAKTSFELAELTASSETIILRWIDRADVASPTAVLKEKYDVPFTVDKDLSETPLPLLDHRGSDAALQVARSPFGRFDLTKEEREAYFLSDADPKRPDETLDRLLDYLVDSFVVTPIIDEADLKEGESLASKLKLALDAAKATLKTALRSTEDMLPTVLSWADRFFAAAPLTRDLAGEREHFDAARLTAAIPRRAEPARMSPDAEGRIAFVHPIAEDWATLRSYSVRLSHRYDDLQDPHARPSLPDYGAEHGRTDSALPRRRPVVQPATLGRDLVLSDRGAPFHSVTLSEPTDLSLSRLNVALARKLEFHDIQRRYDIAFRHRDWLERLAAKYEGIMPDFQPGQPDADADWLTYAPDSFNAEDATALARTPMARFGGVQFLTPAEPHYYDQRMEVRVRAGTVVSPSSLLRLPRPAPMPHVPAASDVPVLETSPLTWEILEKTDIDDQAKRFLKEMPDDLERRLAPHLAPAGTILQMRLPRLHEAVPEASRESWHRIEFSEVGFGHLPDPAARLEIHARADGIRATVATVERNPDPDAEEIFVAQKVSPEHDIGALSVAPADPWHNGFVARLAVEDVLASAQITDTTGAMLGPLPTKLTDPPEFMDRLPKDSLPKSGPLARLTALALRNTIRTTDANTNILTMRAPLIGPRWLTRPHLPMRPDDKGSPQIAPNDLSIGLRLLFDAGRRQALAALVDTESEALRLVETASTVVLTDVLAEGDAFRELIKAALPHGHRFIHLTEEDVSILQIADEGPDPTELAEGVNVGDRIILLTTPEGSNANDYHDRLRRLMIGAAEDKGLTYAQAITAGRLAADLAQRAWRAEAPQLRVAAHRGNLVPSPWETGPQQQGEDE